MKARTKRQRKAHRAQRRRAEREASRLAAAGVVLMLFGVAALVTSLYFAAAAGLREVSILSPAGGTVGPIVVKAPHTVLHVKVRQELHREGWSYVGGTLIDQTHAIALEFGGELWRESGVDSGGRWSESDTEYDLHITVPEPGAYHLAFEAEAGHMGKMSTVPASEIAGPIYVVVQPQRGSAVPFRTAGLLALLIGFLLHETATGAVSRWLARATESPA